MGWLEHDQPEPGGADDGFGAALRAELAEDGVDVELDGMVANPQSLCDGLIGEALGQELQHFQLTRGQILDRAFARVSGWVDSRRSPANEASSTTRPRPRA